ncbi:MAG: hypothetical protein A2Y08_04235 [Planctomycetes bacterium GWA2_40_7]|nr:MAG: hypothetical protein A2Y08_04235 [Planctomycetes bacterium GWA2_40_7]
MGIFNQGVIAMRKTYRINTILLIVISLLLAILIFKNSANYVIAQGDGNARHVFGLVGERQGNRQPLYLIDTEEQTLMVYEYFQGGGLGFVAARNYKYDKKLQDHGRPYGLSIDDVKAELLKAQPK